MGNLCLGRAGAGPGETKGGGKVPTELLSGFCRRTAVLKKEGADASSARSQTTSFLAGWLCNSRSCCLPRAESIRLRRG